MAAAVAAAVALAAALAPTPAAGAAETGDPWRLCADAIAEQGPAAALPDRLLDAVAIAESGRWNTDRAATLAWPWTVTAEGRGRFLPTRAAAIAEVEALRARGVDSIDVGCLQVNLRYHPDAFTDLEQAFDPSANAAYAAGFLARLFAETGSWHRAVGRYHSATPEFGRRYRLKVIALWNAQRRLARAASPATTARIVPVDRRRTAAFDERRRAAAVAAAEESSAADTAPAAATAVAPAVEPQADPSIGDARQAHIARLTALHERNLADVARRQERLGLRDADAAEAFAEARRRQLADWREERRRRQDGPPPAPMPVRTDKQNLL